MSLKACPGRTIDYAHDVTLDVPDTMQLPTCDSCEMFFMSGAQVDMVAEVNGLPYQH